MPPLAAPLTTWSPILSGETAERARTAVLSVAEALGEGPLPEPRGPGLAAGEAGIALFFDALDRVLPEEGYGDLAVLWIERAIGALAAGPVEPSLFAGFTGVAWAAEVLQRRGLVSGEEEEGEEVDDGADERCEDLNASIDEALLLQVAKTPWTLTFDLTGGLVGYGVYALERLPRPAAVTALERIVDRLAGLAAPRPAGVCWHTTLELQPEVNRKWFPFGVDNLGVAHGTPGVIGLLAGICRAGVAREKAGDLLRAAVAFLLSQKLPAGEASTFPYSVGREVPLRPARNAWCYGDPGIAAVLLAAGRALGEPAWEEEALATALFAARRAPESCKVEDACLCHGAGGLGHALNRLYHATGEPVLRDAARFWLERTLDFWQPGQGIGGFLAFTPVDQAFEELGWNREPGYLAGSVGMALALLAGLQAEEPDWDRPLLLSPLRPLT